MFSFAWEKLNSKNEYAVMSFIRDDCLYAYRYTIVEETVMKKRLSKVTNEPTKTKRPTTVYQLHKYTYNFADSNHPDDTSQYNELFHTFDSLIEAKNAAVIDAAKILCTLRCSENDLIDLETVVDLNHIDTVESLIAQMQSLTSADNKLHVLDWVDQIPGCKNRDNAVHLLTFEMDWSSPKSYAFDKDDLTNLPDSSRVAFHADRYQKLLAAKAPLSVLEREKLRLTAACVLADHAVCPAAMCA